MLGILPGTIGVIQAAEVVKLLLGVGRTLSGRLLLFDALRMSFRELKLRKDPECALCSPKRTIHELIDYEQFCGTTAQLTQPVGAQMELDPVELKRWLDRGDPLSLLDVREPHEWQICRIPGATLIPLGQLEDNLNKISRQEVIVVYCRSGVRSKRAVEILKNAGFTQVQNPTGGILAWTDRVDPSLVRY